MDANEYIIGVKIGLNSGIKTKEQAATLDGREEHYA